MVVEVNESRRRRRGPKPLPVNEKREHCISVRVNNAELAIVDAQRGPRQRGEWLRMAAIDRLPPSIPSINQQTYALLAKTAGNLATIANAMRGGAFVELGTLRKAVKEFRDTLIGVGSLQCDEDGDEWDA